MLRHFSLLRPLSSHEVQNLLPRRNVVLCALLSAFLVSSARSANAERLYDEMAFANLLAFESFEKGCKAERAPNIEACVRSKVGPNFSNLPVNAPDKYISDEQRRAIPNRQAGPSLVASALNDRALGVQFQVLECRVVAEITEQQRHNIAKVAYPSTEDKERLRKGSGYQIIGPNDGDRLLKAAMQPAEFDLEEVAGKFWLSVINLATLGPGSVQGMACLSRLKVALDTGDLVRVAAERCDSAAPQQRKPLSLNNLKGKLFGSEGKEATQSTTRAQPAQADPCLTQARGGEPAAEASSSAVTGRTRPPAVNPFDGLRQVPDTNSPPAAGRTAGGAPQLPIDTLPGLPAAPKDSVVIDLVKPPDLKDPEMRELLGIAAALVTPQGINGSQRPQERDTVYRPLAEFLARERTQQRWAEIIGRATVMLKGAYIWGSDGRARVSIEQAFGKKSNSSGLSKITAVPTLELLKILIGSEPPSAAQDSFAPRATKANPMDMLFRVALPLHDSASETVVPMIRVVTYPQLLGSGLAYQTPSGQFEPAGYGLVSVDATMLALGYAIGPSPEYASNYSFLRLRYDKPKGPSVELFDLARVKSRLASGS